MCSSILMRSVKTARIAVDNIRVRFLSSNPGSLVDINTDDEGICTLTMQRPPVNSLNLELLQALSKSLDEIAKNGIKGMVLTSAYPKVFSAGLDINEAFEPQLERLKTHWTTLQDFWIKLFSSEFVSTAAINGHSPAGGCILALACEYRAMVAEKTIGINDTIIGFVPPKWVEESVKLAMSSRQAELALTTSKMYTSEEAMKVGLVDELVTNKEEAIEKCKEFIKKFDKVSFAARIETKKRLRDPILRLLTENRTADLETFIKKIYDERTQNAVRSYFMEMKARKKLTFIAS